MRMVREQLAGRDIRDEVVLAAMGRVPRHRFVPSDQIAEAYTDGPLLIGHHQTISQPYIVASMTQALALTPESRVLEIGTGSGYQTAVLAEIARQVFTVEIIPELSIRATDVLIRLGYQNITAVVGDGSLGWPEWAPYDGVIVTAAAPSVPPTLVNQLCIGGKLVIPVALSDSHQELHLIERTQSGITDRAMYDVRFVLMQGGAGGIQGRASS
jgi:protein-L-isoaspartate(D-aspartate) O-methyltransferase